MSVQTKEAAAIAFEALEKYRGVRGVSARRRRRQPSPLKRKNDIGGAGGESATKEAAAIAFEALEKDGGRGG